MTNETLTKSFINKTITKPFNFRNVDINNWNVSKTVWKELCGYLICAEVFTGMQWVEDKSLQRKGVDFVYKGKYPDEKSLIGDYHDENGLNIVLELSQYGKPSLTADKLTDVLVYTVLEENRVSLVLIPYKKVLEQLPRLANKYIHKTSNNRTGVYIKVPVSDIEGALVRERSINL